MTWSRSIVHKTPNQLQGSDSTVSQLDKTWYGSSYTASLKLLSAQTIKKRKKQCKLLKISLLCTVIKTRVAKRQKNKKETNIYQLCRSTLNWKRINVIFYYFYSEVKHWKWRGKKAYYKVRTQSNCLQQRRKHPFFILAQELLGCKLCHLCSLKVMQSLVSDYNALSSWVLSKLVPAMQYFLKVDYALTWFAVSFNPS